MASGYSFPKKRRLFKGRGMPCDSPTVRQWRTTFIHSCSLALVSTILDHTQFRSHTSEIYMRGTPRPCARRNRRFRPPGLNQAEERVFARELTLGSSGLSDFVVPKSHWGDSEWIYCQPVFLSDGEATTAPAKPRNIDEGCHQFQNCLSQTPLTLGVLVQQFNLPQNIPGLVKNVGMEFVPLCPGPQREFKNPWQQAIRMLRHLLAGKVLDSPSKLCG